MILNLIENKNKEVSTVIQERKRSLDEKSKEVSKITQEKDKEILKLSQSLAASKENLLHSRRMTGDFEIKQNELEEKNRKITICPTRIFEATYGSAMQCIVV